MKYRFRRHPSRLATVMASCGAGSRVEFSTEYPAGIAHFMEHMRFKGSNNITSKDLLKEIAYHGGYMNACTTEDTVSYYITIPEENIEVACKNLAEIMLNPIFPEDELEKERDVVCQEIKAYDDDMDDNVYQETMLWAFSNGLACPVLGFEKTVNKITKNDLLKFNNEFYSLNQLLITVIANQDYKHHIEKYFGVTDDVLIFPPLTPKVEYGSSIAGTIKKEGELQTVISVSFGSQKLHDEAHSNRAALHVFDTIFGAEDDSRLFLRIREDLGLVYGIRSSIHDMLDGSLVIIDTETEPKKKEQVLSAIDEEIDRMISLPPTKEEVARAKNRVKSCLYGVLDTSLGTADVILKEEFYNYESNSEFLAKVNEVTTEEIHELAKNIFDGNKYIAIGVGTD